MKSSQQLSQQEYVLILENIGDAVIAIDQQGVITFFNSAAHHLTGLSTKQTTHRSFFTCFQQQQTLCYLARTALEEGRSISSHETVTLRFSTHRQRQVSVAVSPIFLASHQQQGAVIILHDLTRVHSLEGAGRHADQLTTIKTMAAGLAHEIKNPLGGIKGSAQLLQMELGTNTELQEYTQLIVRVPRNGRDSLDLHRRNSRSRQYRNQLLRTVSDRQGAGDRRSDLEGGPG